MHHRREWRICRACCATLHRHCSARPGAVSFEATGAVIALGLSDRDYVLGVYRHARWMRLLLVCSSVHSSINASSDIRPPQCFGTMRLKLRTFERARAHQGGGPSPDGGELTIDLSVLRSSTRGMPRGLFGSSGSIPRHSKSVRSYRLMPRLNQVAAWYGSRLSPPSPQDDMCSMQERISRWPCRRSRKHLEQLPTDLAEDRAGSCVRAQGPGFVRR